VGIWFSFSSFSFFFLFFSFVILFQPLHLLAVLLGGVMLTLGLGLAAIVVIAPLLLK